MVNKLKQENLITSFDNIKIRVSRTIDEAIWDEYLEKSSLGQYEQSSKWSMVKSYFGWKPLRIIVEKNGEIFGGIQILMKSIPLLGSIGYVTKGPIFKEIEKDAINYLLAFLKNEVKKNRIQYLVVSLPDNGQLMKPFFINNNYKIDTIINFVSATTMIDLTPSLEDIFKNMSKNNRRFIKYGNKNEVKVRSGSEADIPAFFDMMIETCKRQGVDPNPSDINYFYEIWRHFKDKVKLFIAEYNDEVVSGVFGISFGEVFRAIKLGWAGNYSNLKPNQVLFWEAIKWAKEKGHVFFDFVSIDKETAISIKKGEHFSKVAKGPTFFKLMFGGEVYLFPETYFYIYNPVYRFLFSKIFLRMFSNSSFRNLINNIKKLFIK